MPDVDTQLNYRGQSIPHHDANFLYSLARVQKAARYTGTRAVSAIFGRPGVCRINTEISVFHDLRLIPNCIVAIKFDCLICTGLKTNEESFDRSRGVLCWDFSETLAGQHGPLRSLFR